MIVIVLPSSIGMACGTHMAVFDLTYKWNKHPEKYGALQGLPGPSMSQGLHISDMSWTYDKVTGPSKWMLEISG
jgi:hypothetical protein